MPSGLHGDCSFPKRDLAVIVVVGGRVLGESPSWVLYLVGSSRSGAVSSGYAPRIPALCSLFGAELGEGGLLAVATRSPPEA